MSLKNLAIASFFILTFVFASAAFAFVVGDPVEVTSNLNVRSGPGTSYAEITDPDYPGYAPAGTRGIVTRGPTAADGYNWWEVNFGPWLYTGWSVENYLVKTVPDVPIGLYPGSGSEPGPVVEDLTPELSWIISGGANYYQVYVSKYPYGAANIVYSNAYVTQNKVTTTALEAGIKYRWDVSACNSEGCSAQSPDSYFQTFIQTSAPSAPQNLRVSGVGDGFVNLAWDPPSNNGGSSVTNYEIHRGTYSGGEVYYTTISSSWTTFANTAVTNGVTYYYKVKAVNAIGTGDPSNEASATPQAIQTTPSVPTGMSPGSSSEPGPEIADLTPVLSWNSVANADYYKVYLSKYPYGAANIVFSNEHVTGTSVETTSLAEGTKYRWDVSACNNAGCSAQSPDSYFHTSVVTACNTVNTNSFYACYYDNMDLTNLKITRTDAQINFDWGTSSPDASIAADTFSTRWQGSFNFENSDYEFTLTSDDGFRLYVDDLLVLDKWIDQAPTTYKITKSMSAGYHTIKVEYYENSGGAVAKLSWIKIDVGGSETYNTAFFTDEQLINYESMSVSDIRTFLTEHNSYFKNKVQDVDGIEFDASEVIYEAAQIYKINPKVILVTLEKEHSAVTGSSRPSDTGMRFLTGCISPTTAREQMTCTAERFRSYHNGLLATGSTVSGWKVGVPKTTSDGVTVTPATNAVAGQFTYTPYAGKQWGGDTTFGGVYLFYYWWNQFGFGSSSSPRACGDYPYVDECYLVSYNYNEDSRRENNINYVVIHTTGITESFDEGSVKNSFNSSSHLASAHYMITRTGKVIQFVRDRDVAWHAGNYDYNLRSIGIEHEGYANDPNVYTKYPAMADASAKLVRWLTETYGVRIIHPIGVAPESSSTSEGIIGHNQVPNPDDPSVGGGTKGKTDPGQYWDWENYMSLIGGVGGCPDCGTDADGDGYVEGVDCNDNNANIHPGAAESCNNVDDDCDDVVDDGYNKGTSCSSGTGACQRNGVFVCNEAGTGTLCSAVPGSPSAETCDNIDNDCDGFTDESLIQQCGTDTGVCEFGTQSCSSGSWGACTGGINPSTEVCDSADNNCNGAEDEGDVCSGECGQTVVFRTSATGDYIYGTWIAVDKGSGLEGYGFGDGGSGFLHYCSGFETYDTGVRTPEGYSVLQWTPNSDIVFVCTGSEGVWYITTNFAGPADATNPAPTEPYRSNSQEVYVETCGVIDNDGDGYNSDIDCNDNDASVHPGASDSACNGIDNNCNGFIDESYISYTCGAGVCQQASTCIGGTESCAQGSPSTEVCDSLDNDCDGATDETFNVGSSCSAGTGACTAEGIFVCNQAGSGTICNAVPESPSSEICDNVDNDCDGAIDEQLVQQCGSTDVGACEFGTQTCNAGQWGVCESNIEPSSEVCDNTDNDCDSQTDEDNVCVECKKVIYRTNVVGSRYKDKTWVALDQGQGMKGYGYWKSSTSLVSSTCSDAVTKYLLTAPDGSQVRKYGETLIYVCTPIKYFLYTNSDTDAKNAFLNSNPTEPYTSNNQEISKACATDNDNDGYASDVDCDDNSAGINPGEADTICDGIDNNCNSEVDENYVGYTCGTGSCQQSSTCVNGVEACSEKSPSEEICDNADNDCDGIIDETFNTGSSCSAGTGACYATGILVCNQAGDSTMCSAIAGEPTTESCNSIDDDCDGIVDEGGVCACQKVIYRTNVAGSKYKDRTWIALDQGQGMKGYGYWGSSTSLVSSMCSDAVTKYFLTAPDGSQVRKSGEYLIYVCTPNKYYKYSVPDPDAKKAVLSSSPTEPYTSSNQEITNVC